MPNLEDYVLQAGSPAALKPLLDQLTSLIKINSPYSEVELDAFYDIGVQAYRQGKLQDASCLFGMINILSPFNSLYLSAQGKCLKSLASYDDAYQVFFLAWTLDKSFPEPALHAAECLMLAGRKAEAVGLIRDLLQDPVMSTQKQVLRNKAEAWHSLLTCGEIHE